MSSVAILSKEMAQELSRVDGQSRFSTVVLQVADEAATSVPARWDPDGQ